MALARGEPDGGGVSGDGSRIRPRAESQFTVSVQLAHGKAIVTWTHFVSSTKPFLLARSPSFQGCDACLACNTKRREMRADRVGDVARRQVRIVLFRHPRVGVAQLLRDDAHRNSAHSQS
jgi:hypothetical protein